jgi:hypothetical protein
MSWMRETTVLPSSSRSGRSTNTMTGARQHVAGDNLVEVPNRRGDTGCQLWLSLDEHVGLERMAVRVSLDGGPYEATRVADR